MHDENRVLIPEPPSDLLPNVEEKPVPPEAAGTAEAPPSEAVQGPTGMPVLTEAACETPTVCKYWRGGSAAIEELRRYGITGTRDPHGLLIPGENTLVRELRTGPYLPHDVRGLGVCERGSCTLCMVTSATGGGTCPDRVLVVGSENDDARQAIKELDQMANDAYTQHLLKRKFYSVLNKHSPKKGS